MELARMTSKGQLTIPVSIRKKFGIGTGRNHREYQQKNPGRFVLLLHHAHKSQKAPAF